MDGSKGKCRGVGGTDRVVVFLDVYGLLWIVQEQVGCRANKDKANLSLAVGFSRRRCEIRSLKFSVPDPSQTTGYVAMTNS